MKTIVLLAGLAVMGVSLAVPGAAAAPNGADDQVVLRGSLEVPAGSTVKNAVAIDADTRIDGRVDENVVVFSGKTKINGIVGDNVTVFGDRVVVGPRARIGGDLIYADKRPTVAESARIGGQVRQFSGSDIGNEIGRSLLLIGILLLVGTAIGTLLGGLVLIWLAPRAADAMLVPAQDAIGASVGWGLAALIALPIAALIALFTVVGTPIGVFALLALLPLWAVGYLNGMWLVGRWIIKAPSSRYGAFALGWLILIVGSAVPFLGALVSFAAVVYGLGVLVVAIWRARRASSPLPA